jgi:N-acetylneuraminic acid mutarotase
MFAFNTQTNHWRRIDALESKPIGRYGHSAVVYNNTAFIFGGFDSDGFVSNDLLTFDLIQCKWLPKITKTQQWPIPRYHHTVTLFGHLMFVFGGLDTSFTALNDLCCFDLDAISANGDRQCWKIEVDGISPLARFGHCSYLNGDRIYVFGGLNSSHSSFSLEESWVYSISEQCWSSHRAKEFVFATVTYDNESGLFIFGGRTVTAGAMKNHELLDLSQLSDDVLLHMLSYLTALERTSIRLANKKLHIGQLTTGTS